MFIILIIKNLYNLHKNTKIFNEKHLKLIFTDKHISPNINKSLYNYSKNVKDKINNISELWNHNKKYTNIYEFIHTNISTNNDSVSKLKPVSRAFYKLIEIINATGILDEYSDKNIKSFHLAEAPGGFVEALSYYRNNDNDSYYTISIIDGKNKNIPVWKKSNLIHGKNIVIDDGISGTGNLYSEDNFSYFNNKYFSQFDFVTADGGIDFSGNFKNQEHMAFKLILCEIFYALSILKKNGNFVLKIYDIFNKTTIQCVYLLSSLFKSIKILKPKTSRSANSEKYIICHHLIYNDEQKLKLIEKFYKILKVYNNIKEPYYIESFLDINIQHFFINKLQEINSILGNFQIKNILSTIKLIENNEKKNDKICSFKNENIKKCINWCTKNNIPYNTKYKPTNMFHKKM